VLRSRIDLAAEPLLPGWAGRGWPLVARRFAPAESAVSGLALGLPLPPFAAMRRVAVLMRREDVVSATRPLRLHDAMRAAPESWKPTLAKIECLAARFALDVRVFGGLAWSALTGLNYLSARSDLDFLLTIPPADKLGELTAKLSLIEHAAPMRLDGEIVRADGAGVHWRELHARPREILVKTMGSACLLSIDAFLGGRPAS